jgi:hypothetical protein
MTTANQWFAINNWTIRLDGRIHKVRVETPPFRFLVYVDGELACKTWAVHNLYPRELCRFQKGGHEYVLSMKGSYVFSSLELRVDGLVAERDKAEPSAAPGSGAKTEVPQEWQHVELVETTRMEQPLGEDRMVIDNSKNSAEVKRRITLSKEWSQTITIEDEAAASLKGEAGGKVWGVGVKVEAEARIREKYSVSTETRKKYSDEVTITVAGKTRLEVIFAWKQVWQCGIIRVHAANGSTVELPYRLSLELTFDLRPVESVE